MILSILRSVPEICHNSEYINKGSTLVGKSQGPCKKLNYLTDALNRHCSGRSFVLADDRILFSNMDMQHIQHYAYCSLLRKTLFCSYSKIHSVSWMIPEYSPQRLDLEAQEVCNETFFHLHGCGHKHRKLFPFWNSVLFLHLLWSWSGCPTRRTACICTQQHWATGKKERSPSPS